MKLAYWLSDVSEPGRGNLKVVPGSHLVNWIDGPPRRDIQWPDPDGAIEVTAEPGDAVFFDRRIWHTRSRNYSQHTRKAVFFGYTYRWTAIRDELAPIRASDWLGRLTPVQQQVSTASLRVIVRDLDQGTTRLTRRGLNGTGTAVITEPFGMRVLIFGPRRPATGEVLQLLPAISLLSHCVGCYFVSA